MQLQQIYAAYHIDEDRLLFRASLRDANNELQEIRAWITRHLLKSLWSGIVGAMEMQVTLDQPDVTHAKTEIAKMQHEASLMALHEHGSFDRPFQDDIRKFPFGDTPILLTQAHITVAPNQGAHIKFVSARSGHFELNLAGTALHALFKVLQDAMVKVDWGIDLRLSATNQPATAEQRILN